MKFSRSIHDVRTILFVAVANLVFSQSTTQSIQGLVTDSSGAVIAGAKVTAQNTATGISRSVLTNSTGKKRAYFDLA